jgi:predicted phage terminase large subunit-like protein
VQIEFEREAANRSIPVATYGLNNLVDKKIRIRKLSPFLRAGKLRFKAGSRGAEMLVDQMRDFPTGQHDDGPDALEGAIRLMQYMLNPQQNSGNDEIPFTQIGP